MGLFKRLCDVVAWTSKHDKPFPYNIPWRLGIATAETLRQLWTQSSNRSGCRLTSSWGCLERVLLLIKGGMAFLCSSTPAHRKPAPSKSAVYPQGTDMPAAKPAAPPLHSTTARRHEPAHSRKEGKAASNVVARCQEARYQVKALCSWYFAANKLPTRIAVRLCAANHRSLLCKRGAQKKKVLSLYSSGYRSHWETTRYWNPYDHGNHFHPEAKLVSPGRLVENFPVN